jgi:hypothetical protein
MDVQLRVIWCRILFAIRAWSYHKDWRGSVRYSSVGFCFLVTAVDLVPHPTIPMFNFPDILPTNITVSESQLLESTITKLLKFFVSSNSCKQSRKLRNDCSVIFCNFESRCRFIIQSFPFAPGVQRRQNCLAFTQSTKVWHLNIDSTTQQTTSTHTMHVTIPNINALERINTSTHHNTSTQPTHQHTNTANTLNRIYEDWERHLGALMMLYSFFR